MKIKKRIINQKVSYSKQIAREHSSRSNGISIYSGVILKPFRPLKAHSIGEVVDSVKMCLLPSVVTFKNFLALCHTMLAYVGVIKMWEH